MPRNPLKTIKESIDNLCENIRTFDKNENDIIYVDFDEEERENAINTLEELSKRLEETYPDPMENLSDEDAYMEAAAAKSFMEDFWANDDNPMSKIILFCRKIVETVGRESDFTKAFDAFVKNTGLEPYLMDMEMNGKGNASENKDEEEPEQENYIENEPEPENEYGRNAVYGAEQENNIEAEQENNIEAEQENNIEDEPENNILYNDAEDNIEDEPEQGKDYGRKAVYGAEAEQEDNIEDEQENDIEAEPENNIEAEQKPEEEPYSMSEFIDVVNVAYLDNIKSLKQGIKAVGLAQENDKLFDNIYKEQYENYVTQEAAKLNTDKEKLSQLTARMIALDRISYDMASGEKKAKEEDPKVRERNLSDMWQDMYARDLIPEEDRDDFRNNIVEISNVKDIEDRNKRMANCIKFAAGSAKTPIEVEKEDLERRVAFNEQEVRRCGDIKKKLNKFGEAVGKLFNMTDLILGGHSGSLDQTEYNKCISYICGFGKFLAEKAFDRKTNYEKMVDYGKANNFDMEGYLNGVEKLTGVRLAPDSARNRRNVNENGANPVQPDARDEYDPKVFEDIKKAFLKGKLKTPAGSIYTSVFSSQPKDKINDWLKKVAVVKDGRSPTVLNKQRTVLLSEMAVHLKRTLDEQRRTLKAKMEQIGREFQNGTREPDERYKNYMSIPSVRNQLARNVLENDATMQQFRMNESLYKKLTTTAGLVPEDVRKVVRENVNKEVPDRSFDRSYQFESNIRFSSAVSRTGVINTNHLKKELKKDLAADKKDVLEYTKTSACLQEIARQSLRELNATLGPDPNKGLEGRSPDFVEMYNAMKKVSETILEKTSVGNFENDLDKMYRAAKKYKKKNEKVFRIGRTKGQVRLDACQKLIDGCKENIHRMHYSNYGSNKQRARVMQSDLSVRGILLDLNREVLKLNGVRKPDYTELWGLTSKELDEAKNNDEDKRSDNEDDFKSKYDEAVRRKNIELHDAQDKQPQDEAPQDEAQVGQEQQVQAQQVQEQQVKPEVKPEVKQEAQPEVKQEAQQEAQPEVQPAQEQPKTQLEFRQEERKKAWSEAEKLSPIVEVKNGEKVREIVPAAKKNDPAAKKNEFDVVNVISAFSYPPKFIKNSTIGSDVKLILEDENNKKLLEKNPGLRAGLENIKSITDSMTKRADDNIKDKRSSSEKFAESIGSSPLHNAYADLAELYRNCMECKRIMSGMKKPPADGFRKMDDAIKGIDRCVCKVGFADAFRDVVAAGITDDLYEKFGQVPEGANADAQKRDIAARNADAQKRDIAARIVAVNMLSKLNLDSNVTPAQRFSEDKLRKTAENVKKTAWFREQSTDELKNKIVDPVNIEESVDKIMKDIPLEIVAAGITDDLYEKFGQVPEGANADAQKRDIAARIVAVNMLSKLNLDSNVTPAQRFSEDKLRQTAENVKKTAWFRAQSIGDLKNKIVDPVNIEESVAKIMRDILLETEKKEAQPMAQEHNRTKVKSFNK